LRRLAFHDILPMTALGKTAEKRAQATANRTDRRLTPAHDINAATNTLADAPVLP
jgi:hypothetical protein